MSSGFVAGQINPTSGVPAGASPFKAVGTVGTASGTLASTIIAVPTGKPLYLSDLIMTNNATQVATITVTDGPNADPLPIIIAASTTTKVAFAQARQYVTAIVAFTSSVLGGSPVVVVNGGQAP